MFDIGPGELIALAIIAMIVLGPEKLPRYAAEAARFLGRMRQMANAARADVRRELGPEFDDLRLGDLNPRAMVRRQLLDPIDLDSLDDDPGGRQAGGNGAAGGRSRAAGPGGRADKPAARRGPGGNGASSIDGSGQRGPGAAAGAPADRAVPEAPPFDPDTT